MNTDFMTSFLKLVSDLSSNLHVILTLIAVLWVIQIVNLLVGGRLAILGILPRNPWTIGGIFFSPFIHGNFSHVFYNSIPLFVLGSFVLLLGQTLFWQITLFIVVVSGILLWCFGRRGLHIGASGLIMGYWGFLIAYAYRTQTFTSVIPAIITIYYFGGMLLSVLPGHKRNVSWEGHAFGCIAGILTVYCLPIILSHL